MSVTTIDADPTDPDREHPRGGLRRTKLAIAALALLTAAVAGGWFALRPSDGPAAPNAGAILPLESTQINLSSGHYLRLGLALQLVEGAEPVDGSAALDAAIDLFSGRSIAEVSKTGTRHRLKQRLSATLEQAYEGEVLGVYFTEFVTQ